MKKAVLFGASGFVGAHLLQELLNNLIYDQVTIVVRKDLHTSHPKLKTLIGDYHSLPDLSDEIVADDIFIALGTTKKNTPDRNEYYQTDHDYPVLAAKIAREKGAGSIFIVTAVGADPNSKVFYLRTKGETERDIIALNFEHVNIFRPSMITGNRKENRPLEKVFIKLWPIVSMFFSGKLNKYRGLSGAYIAKAMNNAAKIQLEKLRIYHWQEMKALV